MAAFANFGRGSVRDHRFTDRCNICIVQTVVAAAAGAVRPGILLDSIGTSEALFAPIAGPTKAAQFLRASFCQGVVQVVEQSPSYYAIGGMPSAGECVEWFVKLLQGDEDIASL